MELGDLILPVGVLAASAIALYGAWRFYRRYYQAVPPNRALVLFGGRGAGSPSSPGSSVELRTPRIIVGGGVLVPPWRTGAESLSLSPIDVDLRILVETVGTEPEAPPWEVRLAAQVKIPKDPRMLATAAETLLGRTEAEIRILVTRTIESVAPAVVLRELSTDHRIEWDRLAAVIQAAVAPELVAVGLDVRTLSVTQLRRLSTQDRTDILPIGAPHLSRDLLWASGDLGVRLRGVEVRLDRTERSLGLLGAEVMRLGRDGSQFPELPALQPYDSTGDESLSRTAEPDPRGLRGRGSGGATRPLLDTKG